MGNFSASACAEGPSAESCCFPAPVTQLRHPNAQSRFPWPVTLERASLTGLPGAAGQENQLVPTTAQFKNQKKKRQNKSNKPTTGKGRSLSASSLISQRCPTESFHRKSILASTEQRQKERRAGSCAAGRSGRYHPRPDGSGRVFRHLIWLLLLVRSEDFLQTVGRAVGMLGCL